MQADRERKFWPWGTFESNSLKERAAANTLRKSSGSFATLAAMRPDYLRGFRKLAIQYSDMDEASMIHNIGKNAIEAIREVVEATFVGL